MLVFFLFGFYYNIFITTKIHSKGIIIKEKKKKCMKNKAKKKATKPENLRVDKDKSNEQTCISEMLLITTRNHLCSWVKSTGISFGHT